MTVKERVSDGQRPGVGGTAQLPPHVGFCRWLLMKWGVNMYTDIGESTRERVIAMYASGERLKDIVAVTGLSRPTIYWVLKREGVSPNRRPRQAPEAASELVDALRNSEREVDELRQRIQRLEQVLASTAPREREAV
jgi:predicted DNA-binding transcriptional regulator AlpA